MVSMVTPSSFPLFSFKLWILCVVLDTVRAYSSEGTKLPSFIEICHRNDPVLNDCVRNSIQALRDRLPRGIPELFLPPMEPLVVPEVRMDQDAGAIYLHSTYKGIRIYGLSNYTLRDVVLEPGNHKLLLSMAFPNITMKGRYQIEGKIMMMPLMGEGECGANFTNAEIKTTIIVEPRKQPNGRVHLKIKEIETKYKIEKTELRLENLFNGDKALGERMNAFLNENWETLSEEVRPLMEKTIASVVRSATEKLFETYSYDELLPE